MRLNDYLDRSMGEEMALKNRIRQIYREKDEMRGFGYADDVDIDFGGEGTKEGAKRNAWIKFLRKDGKKGVHHTRAELSKMYKNEVKKKAAAKKKRVVKKKTDKKKRPANRWIQFLKEYREEEKKHGESHSLAEISEAYHYMNGTVKPAKKKKRVTKKKVAAKGKAGKRKALGGVLLDY